MRDLAAAAFGAFFALAVATASAAPTKPAAMMGKVETTAVRGGTRVVVRDVNGDIMADRVVACYQEIASPHKGDVGILFGDGFAQVFRNTAP